MKKTAFEIVQTLQKKGFETYWVGGCVRDLILHKEPKDYDIVTSASPDEVEEIFPRTKPLGKEFGIILVIENNEPFEVATFRSDGDYSDGRRPEKIHFSSAEEDALRRDFTINGIFYDPVQDLYKDFVQGRSDLRRGILRFIGKAEDRIREDHLRVLRAIRFKNRFDLDYHRDTAKALEDHSSLVISVSVERILTELNQMLLDPHRKHSFEDLDRFGVGEMILPEVWKLKNIPQPLDHHREGDVYNHSLEVINQFRPGATLPSIWAGLLHDIGKAPTMHCEGKRIRFLEHAQVGSEMVRDIAKRLKFPKALEESLYWMVHHHHIFDQWDEMTRNRRLHYFDDPNFQDLLNLHRADLLGSKEGSILKRKDRPAFEYKEKETYLGMSNGKRYLLDRVEVIQQEYYDARRAEDLPSQNPEFLTGEEIMQLLDLEPGVRVGELKAQLREQQIDKAVTTREEAIKFLTDKK